MLFFSDLDYAYIPVYWTEILMIYFHLMLQPTLRWQRGWAACRHFLRIPTDSLGGGYYEIPCSTNGEAEVEGD